MTIYRARVFPNNWYKGINLAMGAYTYCDTRSDCDSLLNDDYIKKALSKRTGILKTRGWDAKKIDDDTYLLSYLFAENDEIYAYVLEVYVSINSIRNIFTNAPLEEKYWNLDGTSDKARFVNLIYN